MANVGYLVFCIIALLGISVFATFAIQEQFTENYPSLGLNLAKPPVDISDQYNQNTVIDQVIRIKSGNWSTGPNGLYPTEVSPLYGASYVYPSLIAQDGYFNNRYLVNNGNASSYRVYIRYPDGIFDFDVIEFEVSDMGYILFEGTNRYKSTAYPNNDGVLGARDISTQYNAQTRHLKIQVNGSTVVDKTIDPTGDPLAGDVYFGGLMVPGNYNPVFGFIPHWDVPDFHSVYFEAQGQEIKGINIWAGVDWFITLGTIIFWTFPATSGGVEVFPWWLNLIIIKPLLFGCFFIAIALARGGGS